MLRSVRRLHKHVAGRNVPIANHFHREDKGGLKLLSAYPNYIQKLRNSGFLTHNRLSLRQILGAYPSGNSKNFPSCISRRNVNFRRMFPPCLRFVRQRSPNGNRETRRKQEYSMQSVQLTSRASLGAWAIYLSKRILEHQSTLKLLGTTSRFNHRPAINPSCVLCNWRNRPGGYVRFLPSNEHR